MCSGHLHFLQASIENAKYQWFCLDSSFVNLHSIKGIAWSKHNELDTGLLFCKVAIYDVFGVR